MLWKVTSFLKPNPNIIWNKCSILNTYFRFPICQHFFLPKNALWIKKMQQPVEDNWIYNYFSLMFPLTHLAWKLQHCLLLSILDFWNWSSWWKQVSSYLKLHWKLGLPASLKMFLLFHNSFASCFTSTPTRALMKETSPNTPKSEHNHGAKPQINSMRTQTDRFSQMRGGGGGCLFLSKISTEWKESIKYSNFCLRAYWITPQS